MDQQRSAADVDMEVDDGDRRSAINQWSVVKHTGAPPHQRSLHAGIVVGGCLYIFGGYDGSNRVNDLYMFNFKASKWSQIVVSGASPSARDRHVTVSHNEKIYVFAGYDGNQRVNDFWQYDPDPDHEAWSVVDAALGNPPSPRHSHSGVEYDGSMYIFAGYDGNYRSDLHRYIFSQRKWISVPVKGDVPKARYRTSAAAYKNRMLVVGGHDGAKHLNDFYQLSFDTLEWCLVETSGPSPPPSSRDSHSAVICGDSMYLFGGSTGSASNDLYSFTFTTSQWLEVRPASAQKGNVPCPRFCHSCEVYNNSLYVFGGYDGQQRLNDFWQFKLATEVNIAIPFSSLISDLRCLVNEQKLSDVTFIVEGKPVHAHKLLCERCSYFRAMFEGQMREAQQRTVTINNVSHRVFLVLLEYLYTDDVDVSLDIAMDLFVAADQFGVERLKRLCEKKVLGSITVESVATILQAANVHVADGLRQSCMDFILRNFDAVSKTPAFEEMGRSNVGLIFEILNRR